MVLNVFPTYLSTNVFLSRVAIARTPPTVDGTKSTTRNVTVRLGRKTTLFCRAYSGLSTVYPTRYSWTINGKPVPFTMLNYYANLHITKVEYSHAGCYLCTLRNSLGTATITYNLKIEGN